MQKYAPAAWAPLSYYNMAKKEQNISFFYHGYYTNSRKLRVVFFIFIDKNKIAFISATISFNVLLLFFVFLFTIEFDKLDLTE